MFACLGFVVSRVCDGTVSKVEVSEYFEIIMNDEFFLHLGWIAMDLGNIVLHLFTQV